MKCPKCGSENINVQMVTETRMKEKKHGIIYWVFIGWWWRPILWFVFTLPMLIISIFKPKKYKMTSKTKKVAVCNSCGKSWNV